jgi:hypothetical protein
MSVFILSLGEYDDRKIIAVYTTREAAEAELLRLTLADARPVAPDIEEWLVNS